MSECVRVTSEQSERGPKGLARARKRAIPAGVWGLGRPHREHAMPRHVHNRDMPSGKPSYVDEEISPEQNALDYLTRACEEIRALPGDRRPFAWKWLVLSLDSALYTFALCALAGTDWTSVTIETEGKRVLLGFDEIMRQCQSDRLEHTKRLQLTPEQQQDIAALHARRLNVEYTLRTWYVEQHQIVTAAVTALEAIRFLAFESRSVRLDEAARRAVDDLTRKGLESLKATELYKQHIGAKATQEKHGNA